MGPLTAMSRDEVDKTTLGEIAEACHVSPDQIEDVYACTPLQNRAMAESGIHSGASMIRLVLSLDADIDRDRWCAALQRVVSLNTVLRTRLVDCRLGLVQVVISEEHHTRRLSGDIKQYIRDDEAQAMDLGVPLFRSAILDRTLVLTMHHAIIDNSSMAFLTMDMIRIYRGLVPEVRAPFKAFAAYCLGIDKQAAKSFWTSRFKGTPAIFPRVMTGYTPNASQKVTRMISSHRIGPEVSVAHVPLFIEEAWALTAGAYAGSESVAFGVVLSGRTPATAGLETTMGPTISVVPIQVNLQRNMTVGETIRERATALRQLQKEPALQYGLSSIRAVSDAARIASEFQTLLNIRPSFDNDAGELVKVPQEYVDHPNGAFALCLYCDMRSDKISAKAMFDAEVLSERQVHRIMNQFEHTFRSLISADVHTKLGDLQSLNPHDRLEIFQWNGDVPETTEKCIHELFRSKAQEYPAATAVEAWDGSISYKELDEISDRLAFELRRRGVSTGDPIPFIFEKSLWTVVAIFAIMKAGGACVPIDPSNPYDRKAAIVSRARAKTILTSSAEHANSMNLAPDVFAVSRESISNLPNVTEPLNDGICSSEDLAYIMFTSGSMGAPKGVMLEHRCLASSLSALAKRFNWQPGCRILQFAAHVWDISMGEMFGALLFGGCVCIPSEEARESRLIDFIESSKVNWAWFTPTVLRTMASDNTPSLQSMISAGEPVAADAAKTWGKALRLINGWGPTETSILSASTVLTPDSQYPESIGTPVGCAVWFVNPTNVNQLVPIGAIGEILVEGPGVARGYLEDPIRTAASFIAPPSWAPSRKRKSRHFYRTGDLAKYNPDGSICYVGRQDSQVKIRGQRFELGELESVISRCNEVKDILTSTKILGGRTELVAVIVLSDPQLPRGMVLRELSDAYAECSAQHLRIVREQVRAKLPSYMVPTVWLVVEYMPRAASGKLDRVAISSWLKTKNLSPKKAALDVQVSNVTPPATVNERFLQSVWSSLLGVPEQVIGRESSFMQLGGDSILAMQVASRCRKNGLNTTTAAQLKGRSLAEIAESSLFTESAENASAESPKAVQQDSHLAATGIPSIVSERLSQLGRSYAHFQRENIELVVPATDSQAFMLAVSQLGTKAFQVEFKLEFVPSLDTARLRRACEQVVQHHPILRTVFFQHGPVLYQAVLKGLPPESVVEVEGDNHSRPAITIHDGTALARFHLFSNGQSCYRLRVDIHHACYDALSLDLIFRDLDAAYSNKHLSDGLHFHSWISHVEALDMSKPRKYWRELVQDSSMSYLVKPSPEVVVNPSNKRMNIRVPLKNVRTSFGTPSSVIKTAWALLLSQAIGMRDVTFGEISTNRHLPVIGLDEVRGPAVNYLPVRARLTQEMSLASLIAKIQDQSTAGLPHHHMGFRSIIKDCTAWPRWTRFSSVLVYQNHRSLNSSLTVGDANCILSIDGEVGHTADIVMIATPDLEDLEIELHYSSHIFPPDQINWISQCLTTILEGIPFFLEQDLNRVEDSLKSSVESYIMPPSPSTPLPALSNGHAQPPSATAQEVVLEAWRELELLSGDQSEQCSMFSCGADVVTALLLSNYYLSFGYNISTADIIQHPNRLMQAYLVDSKRVELNGKLDAVD